MIETHHDAAASIQVSHRQKETPHRGDSAFRYVLTIASGKVSSK
jgi:hypothetical protein